MKLVISIFVYWTYIQLTFKRT